MTFSVEQYSAIKQSREAEDQVLLEKAVKEKETIEAGKQRARKKREETMRDLMENFKLEDATVKTKRKQEEADWKVWEMMQRFKRNEYDRQFNLEERKRQLQLKQKYRNDLQADIVSVHLLNKDFNIISGNIIKGENAPLFWVFF